MKNEPEIRIKGFEGKWKENRFSDIVDRISTYSSNNLLPTVEFEDIVSGENRLNKDLHSKPIHKGGIAFEKDDVLFGKLRPYLKNILFATFDGIAVGDFWVLRAKDSYPAFVYTLVNNMRFMKVANISSGSKMPRADWNLVSKHIFVVPSLTEQRAIATYFHHLDTLIETADKKLASLKQVKEASLQTMFPQEGQSVPKVRFKGFEGEWKNCKLSTFAKRITRKNEKLETELPVTISSQEGIIAQTQFFNNVVASSNLRGYYLIKKGEFAYNKSYSNGFPYGSVKRLEKYEMGALSTLYIVFSLSNDIDHDYVIYFFETMLWHKEVAMRAAEGARNHGLLNIGAEDFLDIQILVPPTMSEQNSIASFFVHLDKQIEITQQRLALLRRIKSACLDEMFV